METNNRFFYIFLNIKGALYTADWVKFVQASALENEDSSYREIVDKMLNSHKSWQKFYNNQGYLKSKHIRKICPYNVESLNRLLDDLKLDYDVNLVITSPKWKDAFDIKTIPALVKNGLNYSSLIIDKTDSKIESIADGIKTYLAQVGNPSNFIVIDYQDNVLNSFEDKNVIKVDQYTYGLTNELVDNYLDNKDEEISYNSESELSILNEFDLAQI